MRYRPEIDGLRSIAVVPVILFHGGFAVFSGGFVGVDVFFVISGYLITTILTEEIGRGEFSIVRFYKRRARRILPALFLVMACCLPFAWVWMLPSQLEEFSRSIVAVVLFSSNILFWQESGYFATTAELKPLLHTWSLAVEEQYYLLFPIFLAMIWRFGRKRVFWVILASALASLALSEWQWRYSPNANFYLLPTRAWELLAGSLCALWINSRSQRPNDWLGAAGLVLILFALIFYDDNTPFPSVYALAPVGGTALIILFGSAGTWVARLLSLRPFVGIGLISYSAYLWHQPLFAFARIRNVTEPADWLMTLLAALSLVLAFFSWRYVEQPFRKRLISVSRLGAFSLSVVSGLILSAVVAVASGNDYFSELYLSQKAIKTAKYLNYNETDEFLYNTRAPDCFYGAEQNSFSSYKPDKCLALSKEKPNVLLIGDSHAAHLWRGLATEVPEVNFMQATASGCRPLVPFLGETRCTDLLEYIWNEFLPDKHIDAVILSGRWGEDDLSRIPATIKSLFPHADHIVFFGPTMVYQAPLPTILAKYDIKGIPDSSSRFVRMDRLPLSEKMSNIVRQNGGEFVSILNKLCPDGMCMTRTDDGEPMAWDYAHFTASAAQLIVHKLRKSGDLDFLGIQP